MIYLEFITTILNIVSIAHVIIAVCCVKIRVLSVAFVRRWPPVARRARRRRPLSRRAQEEVVEASGYEITSHELHNLHSITLAPRIARAIFGALLK